MRRFRCSLIAVSIMQALAAEVGAVEYDVAGAVNSSTSKPLWSGTYNATVANAINGGSIRLYGYSILNALVVGSISGGAQTFWASSVLNANADRAITGGLQVYNDTTVLNANVAGAMTGGDLRFNYNSALNAKATGSVVGDGYRRFTNSSKLNILATNALDGGWQSFRDASSMNLSADISSSKTYVDLASANSNFYLNGRSAGIGALRGFGTVQNGDLIIDADGAIGGSNAEFNGKLIDGAGQLALTKQGVGVWTYNGDGSGMTGATEVIGGIFLLNGNLSNSAVTVYDDATVGGSGYLGATVVSDGGRLAPGNSIGTFKVNNSLRFNAGSLYDVNINADGKSDRLEVSGGLGNVTLAGGTVNVLAALGDYQVGSRYTILTTTGAITGTFDQVVDNLAFLDAKLMYSDPTKVELMLARNGESFADVAETVEQRDTANAIASAGDKTLVSFIDALDAETARSAYKQLAGEPHASTLTALIDEQAFVRRAMSNRLYQGAGPGWWGKTENDSVRIGSTAKADGLNIRRDSVLLGFDSSLANTAWRLGVLAANSRGALASDGADTKVNTYHLGAYAGTDFNRVQVRVGASTTFSQLESKRQIAFGAHRSMEKGDYSAIGVQSFAELGYKAAVGPVEVEPFINLAAVSETRGKFKEKGDAAALHSDKTTTLTTFTTLGSRLRHVVAVGDRTLELSSSVGVRHAEGDLTPVTQNQFVVGGDHFSIKGNPQARDTLVYDVGVSTTLGHGVTLGVGYAGQSAKGSQSHSGQVEVKWEF